MINKPKSQSFNLYLLVALSFLIPLLGFFLYASRYSPESFIFIAIALIANITILFSFQKRLTNKKSEVRLQKEEYFEKSNLLKAELDKEWRTIQSFANKIISYSQLKDLTESLSMCLNLSDTSNTLSTEISKLFGQTDLTVILYLFHSQTGELGISSSQKGQMQINIKSKKGDIFDQWVIKTMQPLLIEDAKNDFRFDLDKMTSEELRPIGSLISVPLLIGNKALGILRVDTPKPDYFVVEDLRFLRTIADVASIAIENAQLYERIEDLAIKDSVTGLYLRRYMMDRLEEELKRQLRGHRGLSFLMLDLDRFKHYNDQFGHIAGDIVLKTVGKLMFDHFGEPGNLVCRYGGEEFCVLLPDCTKEQAVALAEDFRKKLETYDIILRRQKTHITMSIGVANFPADAQLKEELIIKADQALYQAKELGRNRVCAATK